MRQRCEQGAISLADSLQAERRRLLAEAHLRSGVAALVASYVAIQKSLGLASSEADLGSLALAKKRVQAYYWRVLSC